MKIVFTITSNENGKKEVEVELPKDVKRQMIAKALEQVTILPSTKIRPSRISA